MCFHLYCLECPNELFSIYVDPGLSGPESDWLSTLFDVGGILGNNN